MQRYSVSRVWRRLNLNPTDHLHLRYYLLRRQQIEGRLGSEIEISNNICYLLFTTSYLLIFTTKEAPYLASIYRGMYFLHLD